MPIDNLDKKILYHLDVNARRSGKGIARELRTSKDVINYRIRQMEKRGIIRGYYTLFDFSKLGYMLIRVYVKLKNASLRRENEITRFFVEDSSTLWVAKTEGSWDMAIGYIARSFKEFDESWKKFETRYKRNMLEKNISILFEFVHYRKNYLCVENKKKRDVVGISDKEKIDRVDARIMNIISNNARKSLVEISQELGMTPANVRYRIRGLEKRGIILGYRVDIDLSKLRMSHCKVDIEVEDIGEIEEARAWISKHPNVTYEDRTIGGSNIEFDVEVEGYQMLLEIIDQIRGILGGNIRYVRYYISKDIVKILYIPKTSLADNL